MDLGELNRLLRAGAEDSSLEDALVELRTRQGLAGYISGLDNVVHWRLQDAAQPHRVTGWRYRLAAALEELAAGPPSVQAATAARQAARLYREVLNDGEGTTRAMVEALRASANDDLQLRETITLCGGGDVCLTLLDKALKRPELKTDAERQARTRRALARVAETLGDRDRAFFEAMKAARKLPSEGLLVDEVFRLTLETRRFDEAAAFLSDLGSDDSLPARARANALH